METKTITFNGQWITLPWDEWSAFEISPTGIRTHQGVIDIGAIRLAIWRMNSKYAGRAYFMMSRDGEEIRMMLD